MSGTAASCGDPTKHLLRWLGTRRKRSFSTRRIASAGRPPSESSTCWTRWGKDITSRSGAPPRTWHFATGFTHGRRREQLIVQERVVQHRLKQKGKGYISSSYDVSNAIDCKFVGDTANADFLKTRYRGLHLRPNGDGRCRAGQNACGRNAGDSIMPEQFGEGHNDGVETWAEQTRGDGERSLMATEPTTCSSFDTSISVYADDLWRTGVLKTLDEAQAQVEAWDESIDAQLHLRDMVAESREERTHGDVCWQVGREGDVARIPGRHQLRGLDAADRAISGSVAQQRRAERYGSEKAQGGSAGWLAMGGLWSNNQFERLVLRSGPGRGKEPHARQRYQWIFAAILASVAGGPQTFKDEVCGQCKSDGYKVQITVTQGQECMEMIARCILETGGEEKIGQAPRGPAARHLVKLLKDMGQWEERT